MPQEEEEETVAQVKATSLLTRYDSTALWLYMSFLFLFFFRGGFSEGEGRIALFSFKSLQDDICVFLICYLDIQ